MPYKDPAQKKISAAIYNAKNKERIKGKKKEYYERNKEEINAKNRERHEKNKEIRNERSKEYHKDRKQHAIDSISAGEIIDKNKWNMWCKEIKRTAPKYPYQNDFANEDMFEMMVQGCFYCGDIATTIDRIDSNLDHTLDNCVGCCYGCNISKGVADPYTFIRKAYYRSRGKYYDDDTDVWFVHKSKPRIDIYKRNANNKGVSFELNKEDFDVLIKGDCEYCKRSPIEWFGIDQVVPSQGYVLSNTVSCCFDCNLDKLEGDVESMDARNKQITDRVDAGELIIITECEKVKLHKNKK